MTTVEPRIDEDTLEAVVQRSVGYLTGAAVTAGIALGERLGLYQFMATRGGGVTCDELAGATATHPRLVREWLDAQAAAGLLDYHEETDRYELSPEAALVLQAEDSPVFMAGGAELFGVFFHDLDAMAEAFRGDGSFPWAEHHGTLFASSGRFFRPGYVSHLATEWIPALDGVGDVLSDGGQVADVGCGTGHTSVLIASAYPRAHVVGFDIHAGSLDLARDNAIAAGVEGRVEFVESDATSYDGSYDLIGFYDVLHDLGDPVGAARHAREHLAGTGTVMLVEPMALDDRAENHQSPMAAIGYHASTFLCTPNALSQPGGRALGAQAGEAMLRDVFHEAGYSSFRRAAETPLNAVYEARP